MKLSYRKILAFTWALPFFILSLTVFPYALLGDQKFYREFYTGVAGLGFEEAFQFYQDSLGTSEPGYFVLSYIFSTYINKELLFSVINLIFLYQIFLWMLRQNVSKYLFPLVYCNFYILVLGFSAERLKLSLLFFLVGANCSSLYRYLFYAVSVISHIQTLILLFVVQIERTLNIAVKLYSGRVGFGFVPLLLLALSMVLVVLGLKDHLEAKIHFYAEAWGGWDAIFKPAVFMVLTLAYAPARRMEAFLACLPTVLAAYIVGAERVVIFSYFIFMYYALKVNRGLNTSVILVSSYFVYKGIGFLNNLLLYADGFAS